MTRFEIWNQKERSGRTIHHGWRATGFEDLIGRLEDPLSTPVRDGLFSQPVLDVSPAELTTVKTQAFTADERDTFRFHFTEIDGRMLVIIHLPQLLSMPEDHMRQFVEERLVRQYRNRGDGNLPIGGIALGVAIQVLE